jgi:hypothetical protein
VESTGDPVRDRENQLKEQEQSKKDQEKESSWGSRRTPVATEEVLICAYGHISIYLNTYTERDMPTNVPVWICIRIYMCMYMYEYVCICIYTRVFACIYIHQERKIEMNIYVYE